MDKSQEDEIIKKAKNIAKGNGGKIFAFPTEEENPFSKFALVVRSGSKYIVFGELLEIQEVAQGILETIKTLKRNGINTNYDNDVRFVFYEAQMNSPSLIMKELRCGGKLN